AGCAVCLPELVSSVAGSGASRGESGFANRIEQSERASRIPGHALAARHGSAELRASVHVPAIARLLEKGRCPPGIAFDAVLADGEEAPFVRARAHVAACARLLVKCERPLAVRRHAVAAFVPCAESPAGC